MKTDLQRITKERDDFKLLLEQAVLRVELANREGNPILSAWLTEAKETLLESATLSA